MSSKDIEVSITYVVVILLSATIIALGSYGLILWAALEGNVSLVDIMSCIIFFNVFFVLPVGIPFYLPLGLSKSRLNFFRIRQKIKQNVFCSVITLLMVDIEKLCSLFFITSGIFLFAIIFPVIFVPYVAIGFIPPPLGTVQGREVFGGFLMALFFCPIFIYPHASFFRNMIFYTGFPAFVEENEQLKAKLELAIPYLFLAKEARVYEAASLLRRAILIINDALKKQTFLVAPHSRETLRMLANIEKIPVSASLYHSILMTLRKYSEVLQETIEKFQITDFPLILTEMLKDEELQYSRLLVKESRFTGAKRILRLFTAYVGPAILAIVLALFSSELRESILVGRFAVLFFSLVFLFIATGFVFLRMMVKLYRYMPHYYEISEAFKLRYKEIRKVVYP